MPIARKGAWFSRSWPSADSRGCADPHRLELRAAASRVLSALFHLARKKQRAPSRPRKLDGAAEARSVVAEMAREMLFGMDALEGGVLEVDLVKGRWKWTLHKVHESKPEPPR